MVTNGNISFEELKDKILCEDCLVGMQRIPDGSVDCIITDLPYGTTECEWDSIIPLDKLWEQYDRVLKSNGTAVLFAQQPFTSMLVCSRIELFRHSITWIKDKCANFLAARYTPMKYTEDMIVFSKGNFTHNATIKATYNPQMRILDYDVDASNHKTTTKENCASVNTILPRPSNKTMVLHAYKKEDNTQFPKNYIYSTVPSRSERWHPTQKPVDLLRYLVLTYTNEGDTVLDNCSGSGTTAVACMKEKRHFIGFEKDDVYWKKSIERVKNEQRQLTLF